MYCFSWAITKHKLCVFVSVLCCSSLVSCRVGTGPILGWGREGSLEPERSVAVTISIGDLAVQRRDSRRLAPSRPGRAAIHICRYGDGGWHLFHGRSTHTYAAA